MIKAIYMHKNPNIDYFRKVHINMTRRIPGLRKFTMAVAMTNPIDGSEPAYRLINEVYFDDVDALKRAFDSDEIKVALDDVPNFSDPNTVMAIVSVEEDVPL